MDINHTNNSNQTLEGFEMKFVTSKHLPFVILTILIVMMNALVILLFAFNKNLRKPSNFLLVSLSISDLLFGLVCLPLALVCSTRPICLPCVMSYAFVMFTSISTVLHILVISYERYVKIVFPFRAQQIGRANFELKLVGCVWFVAMLIPPIRSAWMPALEELCTNDLSDEQARYEKTYNISIIVIFLGFPILLLIFADISVFFVVRRQLRRIDKTSVGPRDLQQRLQKEIRVLGLFAVMMLYFVVSWSFYFATIVMDSILIIHLRLPEWLYEFTDILRCTTPLVNPMLYILFMPDFRRVVWFGISRFSSKHLRQRKENSTLSSNSARTVVGGQTDSRNVTERTVFL